MSEFKKALEENGLEFVRRETSAGWDRKLECARKEINTKYKAEEFVKKMTNPETYFNIKNVVKFAKKNEVKGESLKTLRAVKKYILLSYSNNGTIALLRTHNRYDREDKIMQNKKQYLKVYGLLKEYQLRELFSQQQANDFILAHIDETFEVRLGILKSEINFGKLRSELSEAIRKDAEQALQDNLKLEARSVV